MRKAKCEFKKCVSSISFLCKSNQIPIISVAYGRLSQNYIKRIDWGCSIYLRLETNNFILLKGMHKSLDDTMICNESAIYEVHVTLSCLEGMLQLVLRTFPPQFFNNPLSLAPQNRKGKRY